MGASHSVSEKSIHEFTVKVVTYFFSYPLTLYKNPLFFVTLILKIIVKKPFFFLQDAKGRDVNLSTYKGKVIIVVNVASKWFNPTFSNSIFFVVFMIKIQSFFLFMV